MINIFSIITRWVAVQRSVVGSELELDTEEFKKKQSDLSAMGMPSEPSISLPINN